MKSSHCEKDDIVRKGSEAKPLWDNRFGHHLTSAEGITHKKHETYKSQCEGRIIFINNIAQTKTYGSLSKTQAENCDQHHYFSISQENKITMTHLTAKLILSMVAK